MSHSPTPTSRSQSRTWNKFVDEHETDNWIVFGTIFAGAVHDYLSGMVSMRNGGASLPDTVGYPLGSLCLVFAAVWFTLWHSKTK